MLLVKSPESDISVNQSGCQLSASPNSPHIVCRFAGATSYTEAYERGIQLAQERLDILSITGHADLITHDTEDEHLVWWVAGGKRTIALVSTATFSMKTGPATIIGHDAQGNPIHPVSVIPKHHLGFRFYRLSQTSNDLFDAYRNMYLAFESLMSSQYPPMPRGKEIDWLRQSLTSAYTDLALSNLVPATATNNPVNHILNIIYNGARLPLFHAKDGRAYFVPFHYPADRKAVASALTMLTHIVLRMAKKWFSASRIGGWVNLEQIRTLFRDACFVFSDNPAFTLKDGLESESISKGKSFPAKLIKHFQKEVRYHLFGKLSISEVFQRERLHALYLVNTKSPLFAFSPYTTVDLNGFDDLQVILFIRGYNASKPKYVYSR